MVDEFGCILTVSMTHFFPLAFLTLSIMNGPMGVFEFEAFNKGTFGIVNILADLTKEKGAVTIIGGGDSVAATELSGRAGDMSHISTGGGASLELLEGKELPGVVALDDK